MYSGCHDAFISHANDSEEAGGKTPRCRENAGADDASAGAPPPVRNFDSITILRTEL